MTEMKKDIQYYRELPYTKRVDREHDEGEWETYYAATISELPGCMATGKTRQEALCNLKYFFDEYIEGLLEWRESIPEPIAVRQPRLRKRAPATFAGIPVVVVLKHEETVENMDILSGDLGSREQIEKWKTSKLETSSPDQFVYA